MRLFAFTQICESISASFAKNSECRQGAEFEPCKFYGTIVMAKNWHTDDEKVFGLPKVPCRAAQSVGFEPCSCKTDNRVRYCDSHEVPSVKTRVSQPAKQITACGIVTRFRDDLSPGRSNPAKQITACGIVTQGERCNPPADVHPAKQITACGIVTRLTMEK